MFEKVREYIEKFDTIIIHRHKNPDGDAIGSQVGLLHIIKENYPEKTVYAVGDKPGRYAFMDDSDPDEISDSAYEGALAFVLDTSAKSLISDERYKTAAMTVRLDHHIFVENICEYEVTDTSFESCCGLITAFAMEQDLKLSPVAAKSLYTGMVTDSGRFRYDSTNSGTFNRAAFIISHDFSANDIYRKMYADDFSQIQLRAKFVLKIKFTENGEGVLCEIRSSLYNINPIAVKYGGGGHEKASGATLKNYDEAMALLADLDNIAKEGKKA